ncbi:MAG: hypothetical protein R3B48_18805 [Kofleriaceae bacterium]
MEFDPALLAVLVCPVSKSPLRYVRAAAGRPAALVCPTSRLLFRIDEGVAVLLREEAVALDESALATLLAAAEDSQISGG